MASKTEGLSRVLETPPSFQCVPNFPEREDNQELADDRVRHFIESLKKVREDGSAWEQAIWKRLNDKLNRWPQDGAKFGFKDGTKFTIIGISCLWDESRYREFDAIPITNPREPFIAFHASNWKNYIPIIQHNFHPRFTTDGWYGNGCYFTSHMIYSQHYIAVQKGAPMRGKNNATCFQLPDVGHTIYTLAVLLKPGKSFFVANMDFRNKGVADGYDSHHTYVVPKEWSVGMRPLGVEDRESAIADEYVMFDPKRMCPRFLIELRRDA